MPLQIFKFSNLSNLQIINYPVAFQTLSIVEALNCWIINCQLSIINYQLPRNSEPETQNPKLGTQILKSLIVLSFDFWLLSLDFRPIMSFALWIMNCLGRNNAFDIYCIVDKTINNGHFFIINTTSVKTKFLVWFARLNF